jgi:ABC-type dipeptide/oligopeptide/nickel transport system permease subunit
MARRKLDTGNKVVVENFLETTHHISEWRRFIRVFFTRGMVTFGLVVLLLMMFAAIFAGWITPYDPYKTDPRSSLAQPSKIHLLGTDNVGRDTLSRLLYGARTALIVGFVTVFTSAVIGVFLGLIAGYSGGIIGMFIMRTMDALMCFPMIMLAILVSAVLGGGMKNVIIALTFASVPVYARVVNGMTLSLKENDYILAEQGMGSSNLRIIFGHILPNTFPQIIVLITLGLGNIILAEAGLSFLGIGIGAPEAAWGSMVSDGYKYLLSNPILSFAPGLAIMLVVFAFNLVGDGLRDALDPRLRGYL